MKCLPALWWLAISATLRAQEWPSYGNDPGGTRYSPLAQIHRGNVRRLRAVWTFHTRDASDGSRWAARSTFEATPLMIGGVLYVSTPFARVFAVNADTGEELWCFDPRLDRFAASRGGPTNTSGGCFWERWTGGSSRCRSGASGVRARVPRIKSVSHLSSIQFLHGFVH
jgi:quinoprotein glucose dehydrogenase